MKPRRLTAVTPPSAPWHSPEVRLLIAMVASAAVDDWGIFDSAVLREEALARGELSQIAKFLRPEVVAEIAGDDVLNAILGHVDVEGDYVAGAAHLSPTESEVWHYLAQGLVPHEIAPLVARGRRSKQFGVSVEAVYKHVQRGRAKLTGLFVA